MSMTTLLEQMVLGIAQGVLEWLPVSSEGAIILIKTSLFHHQEPLKEIISEILFLHLGSMMAAIIYFRNDIKKIILSLINKNTSDDSAQPILIFLILSTLISGILGLILLQTLSEFITQWPASTQILTLAIGLCLLITGILQLSKKETGSRLTKDLTIKDGIILGITQGFAALPGLSRSGLTVAALIFRKYDAVQAIRLSFLMSIPIVLAGNIFMLFKENHFQSEHLIGLGFSFVFSLLTINILLKIAKKINFGVFVIAVGSLVVLCALFF